MIEQTKRMHILSAAIAAFEQSQRTFEADKTSDHKTANT